MNRCIVLLLATCSIGCNYKYWEKGDVGHILIKDGIDPVHQEMVRTATIAWTEALDQFITFEYVDSTDFDHSITVSGSARSKVQKDHGNEFVGFIDGKDIQLSNDIDNSEFMQVSLHELGHAMGLSHSGSGTIMAPFVNDASHHIVCADVRQFCQVWTCKESFVLCNENPYDR